MKNGGEGSPPADLSDALGSKSDFEGSSGSPPSRYSSFGECEFDRYCSANSALGTPSLCSSSHFADCVDSEFGSFRSSGFGEDSSFDNFSLGGRLDRSSEQSLRARLSRGSSNSDQVSSSNNVIEARTPIKSGTSIEGTLSEATNASFSELGGCSSDVQLGQMSSLDHGEEGDMSKHRHSEDEDSMYNYGSDDDSGNNLPYLRNIHHDVEVKDGGNPFLMNSSVAFGADDWDDYVQETGEVMPNSLVMDSLREAHEENLETLLPLGPVQVPDYGQMSRSRKAHYDCGDPDDMCSIKLQDVEIWRRYEDKSLTGNAHEKFHGEDTSHNYNQVRVVDESEEYLNSCSIMNVFEMDREPIVEKAQLEVKECPKVSEIGKVDLPCMNSEKLICIDRDYHAEEAETVNIDQEMGTSLSDSKANQLFHHQNIASQIKTYASDDEMLKSPKVITVETDQTRPSRNFQLPTDIYKEHNSPSKVENVELSEFLDDVLHDMEEILLDSTESPGARFSHGKRATHSESTLFLRDGGLTASISTADDVDTFIQRKRRIDGVEVIGAKQKKGDVSLSERLVGVKEYTVYVIKVWSGNDRWEVERRYRDFLTLYRRLKSFFVEQGWSLPPEWSSVDKESRKIFGSASPVVISERSALIQDCLQSVIHSRCFTHPPNALLWFLSPQDSDSIPSSPNNGLTGHSNPLTEGAETESISSLGKTIPLIVENRPYKSTKQLLEGQHYCCAGCRKHFDQGRTLVREFVQTLGWGRPRLCEYMGQLFCSSCHTNETAVLPARVLHYWDFTEYPVCQLAKSYLDSIHDKPMLCVSAVNPFLFAKVPGLLHVMGIRRKIGSMLPYIRCPFRRSINQGLGSRRYLLESNDFFALRDLIDLSKGAFAALPTMLETVSRRILEHIAEQCLICCDVGIPCNAKQACRDPSSLIFPFQEDEVERCTFCKQVFHKQCFKMLGKCPCQVHDGPDDVSRDSSEMDSSSGALDILRGRSGSFFSPRLLSTLFPKVGSERKSDHKDNDTIILMGSLPSTSF